jgi:hypothetical protein
MVERYRGTYKDLWSDAKRKIEADANEYKKRITEEIKYPQA